MRHFLGQQVCFAAHRTAGMQNPKSHRFRLVCLTRWVADKTGTEKHE